MAALSFEVFPPKAATGVDNVVNAVKEIAAISPEYISVTYGAGGGISDYTVDIARTVKDLGVTPLAHLTCICHSKRDVREKLSQLKNLGIENVLALRGDIAEGYNLGTDYSHADELVKDIKDFGGFCIGGACYPEGHPESKTLFSDIENLKSKVDAGCDFLTTQMFFDNDVYYSFLSKVQARGIAVPIIPGIMPVTNAVQIKRITTLSGTCLPTRFRRIVDRFGDNPQAMKQAGIAYATEQIIDLYANGITAVHVYCMNKPDVAKCIKGNLFEILC